MDDTIGRFFFWARQTSRFACPDRQQHNPRISNTTSQISIIIYMKHKVYAALYASTLLHWIPFAQDLKPSWATQVTHNRNHFHLLSFYYLSLFYELFRNGKKKERKRSIRNEKFKGSWMDKFFISQSLSAFLRWWREAKQRFLGQLTNFSFPTHCFSCFMLIFFSSEKKRKKEQG